MIQYEKRMYIVTYIEDGGIDVQVTSTTFPSLRCKQFAIFKGSSTYFSLRGNLRFTFQSQQNRINFPYSADIQSYAHFKPYDVF